MSEAWFADWALMPEGVQRDVRIVVRDGRFASIAAGSPAGNAIRLRGVTLPGFANAHSHAFHRALRGRTDTAGDFWSWRRQMYRVAERLDPDSYYRLARAVFSEMVLAGFTAVGEFHYLHHAPGGRRYAEPDAMGRALLQAAADAGIRMRILDALYLAGGLDRTGHLPLDPLQRRFADSGVQEWAARGHQGLAVHSIRAVPREHLAAVREIAGDRPLHVHLSEQPAENAAAQAFYGRTPAQLLADAGLLGPATTAVHATHLTPGDIAALGGSGTTVCLCPSTERDLGDGIGPAAALHDAGSPLALGTDQQAIVDPFEEVRALEMHERLVTGRRGRFSGRQLLQAAADHACLGFPDAGALAAGARADLVTVRLDRPRTAGIAPEHVLLSASAAEISTVMVDGTAVVQDGRHRLGDVGILLQEAIAEIQEDR